MLKEGTTSSSGWPGLSTEIGRLRVRIKAAAEDAKIPVWRQRLSHALRSADLSPPGMPPSAILIVRRIQDPAPGTVLRDTAAPRLDQRWERAARGAARDALHRAARPARGPVAESADAVYFADRAELLACLAVDIAHGRAGQRWWWRALLRKEAPGAPAPRRLAALLEAEPRYVPAALDHLRQWRRLRTVVRAIGPTDAERILRRISDAFGMGEAIPTASPPAPFQTERAPDAGAAGPSQTGPIAETSPRVRAPWEERGVGREVLSDLGPPREALAGVAVTLHRAPARARSTRFREALRQWWVGPPEGRGAEHPSQASQRPSGGDSEESYTEAPTEAIEPSERDTAGNARETRPHAREAAPSQDSAEGDRPEPGGPEPTEGASEAGPGEEEASPTDERPGETHPQDREPEPTSAFSEDDVREASPGPERRSVSGQDERAQPDRAESEEGGPEARSQEDEAPPSVESPGEAAGSEEKGPETERKAPGKVSPDKHGSGVDSEVGGVLYLVNLLSRLGLPEAFEPEWGLASRVGAWGVLDALGRGLLDGSDDSGGGRYAADPIWRAMAVLDHREPETPPGDELVDPGWFSLPASWLTGPVEAGVNGWSWAADEAWLRVWAGEGYLVAEGRRAQRPPAEEARAWLDRIGAATAAGRLVERSFDEAPVEAADGPLMAAMPLAMRRWTARVLPYVRLWLTEAIGLAPGDRAGIVREVLEVPARVYLSSSHVDMVTSMERISLPVRMAGLDRDPGWQPALGRVVLFHFQ